MIVEISRERFVLVHSMELKRKFEEKKLHSQSPAKLPPVKLKAKHFKLNFHP